MQVISTVLVACLWMNILHLVTSKKQPSPAVQKLQQTCKNTATCPLSIPKAELKEKLTPEQYRVTQLRGTEKAFTGELLNKKDEGSYHCVVCHNRIFLSDHKYNSHSGWPSFSDVPDKSSVTLANDLSQGMTRSEVICGRCGAHLGHVFDDGPRPTGLRYCINSVAMYFVPQDRRMRYGL